jgi:spore coat protein H
MRKVFTICFLFFAGLSVYAQNVNPGFDSVFRYNELSLIEITMSESDKQALIFPDDPQANIYYPITIRFKNSLMDETRTNVGIRIRGNTSRNAYKKSFKIDFKEFGGPKFKKHKKFNLKAQNNDPSMLREFLSLYMYRMYKVPAARAHHAEVYINGEYMGIYVNIEQIDDEFVDRRYKNEDGNLYKCHYGATLQNDGQIFWEDLYELKTNEEANDRSILENMVILLNSYEGEELRTNLEPVFDVHNFLRQMAVEALIGHWDGYSYLNNNYYLYEEPISGKVVFIPYDVDNTYGIDWVDRDWGTRNVTDWASHSKVLPLNHRLLAIDDYFEDYCRHMVLLSQTYFTREHLDPLMESLQSMISDAVSKDNYFPYSYTDFLNTLTTAYGGHVEYGIKPYIDTRLSTSGSQLTGYEPFDTTKSGNTASIEVPFSAPIKLFPNPVKQGYFFAITEIYDADIAVIDQVGRQVPVSYFEQAPGEYRLIFDQQPLPGWYLLKVGNTVEKFIVQ